MVAAGGVAFDPLAGGTTTVSATIAGFISTTAASVEVTVAAPDITVNAPATVGSGLQQNGSLSLQAGNHGGVTVTIASSDDTVALVSPNVAVAGSPSINVAVADGVQNVTFYVHGVEGAAGTVTIAASAAGFTDGSDTTAVVQPALRLINLATSTTTLTADDPFQVQVGIPNNDHSNLAQAQAVRAGSVGLTATVTNLNAAVGQLVTDPGTGQSVTVVIAEGQNKTASTVAAGGVAFDPLAGGTTTVSAAIAGFIATDAAAVDVTVTEE
jgi:hypothetical protein